MCFRACFALAFFLLNGDFEELAYIPLEISAVSAGFSKKEDALYVLNAQGFLQLYNLEGKLLHQEELYTNTGLLSAYDTVSWNLSDRLPAVQMRGI